MLGIDVSIWLSLIVYIVVTAITPGPNNMMLMTSGANFGFRRTIPHLTGVILGFTFFALLTGFGLIKIINYYPALYYILKYAGISYLLYLSYRIAITNGRNAKKKSANNKVRISTPFGFWQAAAFQLINPKGVMMVISYFTTYLPPDYGWQVVMTVGLLIFIISPICSGSWLLLGSELSHFLGKGRRQEYFNWTMAMLLVLSLVTTLLN
ncbi:MAG: LysE family translocator [Alphaproteobacteria bacterium]|nr:LysE family translocator [Alphaproteobacteria bacterium]